MTLRDQRDTMPGRSFVDLTDAQRAAMERARERMPTIQRGSFYLVFEAGFLAGLSREDERLEEGQSLIEAIIGPCSDEATEAAAMVVQEALDAHDISLGAAVAGRFGRPGPNTIPVRNARPLAAAPREDEGLREAALVEVLAVVRGEREAMKASRDLCAAERDQAKQDALGRFHDLRGKEATAIRQAAEAAGVKQGAMRLGDVVMAVAEFVLASPGYTHKTVPVASREDEGGTDAT